MGNTYTQLYIHAVFAVKGRQNLVPKTHKEELHKYITGLIQERRHKLLAIHCMPDHTHIFWGLNPAMSISDLIRDVKASSSSFIKRKNWGSNSFSWQEGYGAFSYSRSQVDNVVRYIHNQEEHHKKKTFKDEYLNMLEKFTVDYSDAYLFDWIE